RIGNHLVGNDAGAAGIEVQTFPFELRFDAPMQIAVTGAHSPKNRLGNRPLIPWWSYRVNSGETLRLAYPQDGARTYVTFAGGLDVPLVLGSRSTQLRDGFGGFGGRALAKGDRLGCGASEQPVAVELGATPPRAVLPVPLSGDALSVRAIPGADYEAFTEAARSAL